MATWKMFHEGFTEDELEYPLEHPDRPRAIGKRDYAMMVLGWQMARGACDVVRLELGSTIGGRGKFVWFNTHNW